MSTYVYEHEEIAPGDPNQSFNKMYYMHLEGQQPPAVALQDKRLTVNPLMLLFLLLCGPHTTFNDIIFCIYPVDSG